MIGKSGLLSILQFVALIVPAFAIFMQLTASQEMEETVTIYSLRLNEYKIFQTSLLMVVIGGAFILYRLSDFIETASVGIGIFFIFFSLPVTVIGIQLLSVGEISQTEEKSETFTKSINALVQDSIRDIVFYAPAIIVPLWMANSVTIIPDQILTTGIFSSGWIITPYQFFTAAIILLGVRGLGILKANYKEESQGMGEGIGYSLGIGLGLPLLYLLLTIPTHLAFYWITNIVVSLSDVTAEHAVFNLPYIWTGFLLFGFLTADWEGGPEDN